MAPGGGKSATRAAIGGEAGALIRAKDWSATPLGPIERWPESLRTAVNICLECPFAFCLWWGPDLVFLYNDAYAEILAEKHPAALGGSGRDTWREIWDVVGPMLDGVMRTGQATHQRDLQLIIERRGFKEECYFEFSYSPIRDEQGQVAGIFTPVTETTQRVIDDRRLHTLRDLAARGGAPDPEATCRVAAEVLAENPCDVPFASIYVVADDRQTATRVAASGIESGHPAAPDVIDPAADDAPWPLAEVIRSGRAVVVDDLARRFAALPTGGWPDPPTAAILLPIALPGQDKPTAILIAAVSPRRPLDDDYRLFFDRVAAQLSTALADATAHEAERRRAEALAELDRAKTLFFSNISHEFRTPLTLLLSPTEDALARSPAALTGDDLQIVHRNGLRLLKLVNALLDFARMESGRASASYVPTDLTVLTRDLVSGFRSAIERAGLALEIAVPRMPEPAYVDHDLWEKIVLNLLSNALKFTFAGRIGVSLAADERDFVLRVSDTGTGIAPDQIPRVFQRFHRIEGVRARTHEGTGIGLALVQEMVRMHRGQIRVESVVDRGTTFEVRIPRGFQHLPTDRIGPAAARSTAVGIAPFAEEALRWSVDDASAATVEPAAAARILVVDDNTDMRSYLARILGAHWQVDEAADGVAALAAASERPPDLIITDVMMPRMDGFALLAALRARAETRDVPVVMLSARAGEDARVDGISAGADDYLIKPFSAPELVARVRLHLRLATARRDAVATADRLREALRLSDECVGIVAHDLRSPLNAIQLSLELILEELAGTEIASRVRVARASTERMARLIERVLDFARAHLGGGLAPRLVETNLLAIARQVCDEAQATSSTTIELRCHGTPTGRWDPDQLGQALANLVHNAVQHGDGSRPIRIDVMALPDEDVTITVSNGGAIPAELLPVVFQPFRRRAGRRDGLGLGLYIARAIVVAHRGTLEVTSTAAAGTTFTLTLPRLATADVARPVAAAAADEQRPLVVIAEDDGDVRDVLRDILEAEGYRVACAGNGKDAFDLLQAGGRPPSLLLLDLMMPVMDGWELLDRIGQAGISVPVVALSASDTSRVRGRVPVLSKPIGRDALLRAVRDYVALR